MRHTAVDDGIERIVAVLEKDAALVRRALQEYLPRDEPAYHYELVSSYPQRGGRMLRPALCLEVAQAHGVSPGAALQTAVAIELLHNAFLVHDDIEDESTHRRGGPTLHSRHGVPVAVNVGDSLAFLSLRPLLDNGGTLGPERALAILVEFERMGRETIEGQAIELGWRRDGAVDLTEASYLRMVLKKTCWYTVIFPCRAGAIIGGVKLPEHAFLRFGFFVGAAFQIQDDLLNLAGDEARYGKEIGGDIFEGKRTLPFLYLRETMSGMERRRLDRIFRTPREAVTPEEVAWVVERMSGDGGPIDRARATAHALAGAGRHEFALAFSGLPDSPHRRFVADLVEWVIARA